MATVRCTYSGAQYSGAVVGTITSQKKGSGFEPAPWLLLYRAVCRLCPYMGCLPQSKDVLVPHGLSGVSLWILHGGMWAWMAVCLYYYSVSWCLFMEGVSSIGIFISKQALLKLQMTVWIKYYYFINMLSVHICFWLLIGISSTLQLANYWIHTVFQVFGGVKINK